MKRGQRRTRKFCRRQRQYEEQSARFTQITGSIGFSGLYSCILYMQEVTSNLEQAALDPEADTARLASDLERLARCSQPIHDYITAIRNSCIRYINAHEENGAGFPGQGRRIPGKGRGLA